MPRLDFFQLVLGAVLEPGFLDSHRLPVSQERVRGVVYPKI
jgi:hypothetical protein